MKKILLAINHKETEETIKTMVRDDFLCVGTATYKEAVLPLLKDTQPDAKGTGSSRIEKSPVSLR